MRKAIIVSLAVMLLAGIAWPQQDQPQTLEKVDINAASVEELKALPAIGTTRAEMIIRIRERNGPFKKIEELRALPRLSEKQFEALRKRVTVGPVAPEKDSKDR